MYAIIAIFGAINKLRDNTMASPPTAHLGAQYGEIAEKVIMAGDPLRAKFMAETYLENPVLFNEVRGMYGYTGTYKGKRVSVMGSGMGMPSIGIYSYELFNFFDVDNIIRIGSAGGMCDKVKVRDIVIAQGACTTSRYSHTFNLPGDFAPISDFTVLRTLVEKSEELGIKYEVGNVLSSDVFYGDTPELSANWQKMGVLAVEMEASALYMNAARSGNEALCICTISDSLVTGEACSAEQRQTSFTNMMEIAFNII